MGKKSKEKLKKIVKNQKTLCGNFNLKGDIFEQFFNTVIWYLNFSWPIFGHLNFFGEQKVQLYFSMNVVIFKTTVHIFERDGCYINVHFLGKVKVPVDIYRENHVWA